MCDQQQQHCQPDGHRPQQHLQHAHGAQGGRGQPGWQVGGVWAEGLGGVTPGVEVAGVQQQPQGYRQLQEQQERQA